MKLFYHLLGRAGNTVLTDKHAWEWLPWILDCYSEEQQRLFKTLQENFVNLTVAVQYSRKLYNPLQYYGIQSTNAWEHFSCLATDGNRLAIKVSHIPLVVMSVVAIVVHVIPLTNVGCWLHMAPSQILLQWVKKIKPLLDAYQRQYRDKFRYWTELLLLVCWIILFAISGGNSLQRSSNQPLSHNNYICNSTGVWVNAAGKDETTWILKLQHSDRWDSLLEIMR